MSCLFSSALVHAQSITRGILTSIGLSPVFSRPTMHNNLFSGRDHSYIRMKSEVGTLQLVDAFQYVNFFCWQFQGGADICWSLFKFMFHVLCCLYFQIYMLKTWSLPCAMVVCVGEGAIKTLYNVFVLFVWFDTLRPLNNLSVKQRRVFLGWTSTKLGKMFLAQGPQRSDAGEARTRGPSVSSQAL